MILNWYNTTSYWHKILKIDSHVSMLSHVCLKSTKKVVGKGKHNWVDANVPEHESIGPLYLSDQDTQNVHLLYLVIYCCIEFVTDISKYITCVIGQVYRFRLLLKLCKYVCARRRIWSQLFLRFVFQFRFPGCPTYTIIWSIGVILWPVQELRPHMHFGEPR